MVATAVTLNDLEIHSPLADVFKCNPSNICATFYTISTDSVLALFLCINRASCKTLDMLAYMYIAACVLLRCDTCFILKVQTCYGMLSQKRNTYTCFTFYNDTC